MSPSPYRRTYLRRLEIRNFRSIEHVTLEALPEIVVLHGPNGSGKSNLLRAVRLLLRVASKAGWGEPPMRREDAWEVEAKNADHEFELSLDDFHRGASPEIQIHADIEVGDRGLELLAIKDLTPFTIHLELFIQAVSDKKFRIWFEDAKPSNGFTLGSTQRALSPGDKLIVDRIRLVLLEKFLLSSHAERRVERESFEHKGKAGLQNALMEAALSEREEEAQALPTAPSHRGPRGPMDPGLVP